MKKKSIITVILLGVAILLFNNKVMAASSSVPILGYLECDYRIDKVYAYGEVANVRNGSITFAYSEIKLSSKQSYYKHLYVKTYVDDESYFMPVDNDLSRASHFGFPNVDDGTGITSHLEEMDTTFRRIMYSRQSADFSCPKYLILKKSDNSYIPKFSDDKETYCGPNLDTCLVFGELRSHSEEILYGNEKGWEYTFGSDAKDDCKDLTLKLYIDAPNTNLKASISYPSYSSFFDKSAGREVSVDVEIDEDDGFQTLRYIHNLLSGNQIYLMKINGDSGKEKVILNNSQKCEGIFCGTKYCTLSNQTFNETRTCKNSSDISEELNEETTEFNDLFEKYKTMALENLDFSGESSQYESNILYYSVKDYSNYSDSSELNKKIEELESFLNNSQDDMIVLGNLVSSLESMKDGVCTDDQIVVQNLRTKQTERINLMKQWLELTKQSIENMSQRLLELGDLEAAEKSNALLGKLDDSISQIQHYYEVSKTISFIKGSVSLNFTDDCGIITPKLKQWLIRGLDILKVVSLVLTLILGMIDFFRGLASGSADTMKKVWTSFSRRLIVVVILFLLPVILEFIFGVVNIEGVISTDPLCGINK